MSPAAAHVVGVDLVGDVHHRNRRVDRKNHAFHHAQRIRPGSRNPSDSVMIPMAAALHDLQKSFFWVR